MIQLVQPNLNTEGAIGACLSYARRIFDAPAGIDTAWQAWENTKYKHNGLPPSDGAVPCWFRYPANGTLPGHVVISVPETGFYSSPYSTSTKAQYQQGTNTRAVLPSITEVEGIYHCKYVGWSEDINGVRVAQEGNDMTKEQAEKLSLYLRLLDFESVDEANSHSEDDVSHMLADPGYAGALAEQIYRGQHWQDANHKVVHYDADVAAAASTSYVPYSGEPLFVKKGV